MRSAQELLEFLKAASFQVQEQTRAKTTSEFHWNKITADSRQVRPGTVFFAIPGAKFDGRQFIEQARTAGAAAIFVPAETKVLSEGPEGAVPIFAINDIRRALAQAAALQYGFPSRELRCVGITGTNGKTSTSWLIAQLLAALDAPTLLCGTLGIGVVQIPGETPSLVTSANTTADPITLQSHIRDAVDTGVGYLVMEVTSQGIVQERCSGIDWDIALFTNLSRDHLDLHGSFEAYRDAKFLLFSDLLAASDKPNQLALFNVDDVHGAEFFEKLKTIAPQISSKRLSTRAQSAEYVAIDPHYALEGLTYTLKTAASAPNEDALHQISSRLLGRYNLENTLAAIACVHALGFPLDEICRQLPKVSPVPGRLQRVGAADIHVFVDYAHTPDALENVLQSVRDLNPEGICCVFGCGGDRDRGKRPLMGQVVAQLADRAIVTSDNPRTEDPQRIIEDVLPGLIAPSENPGFTYQALVDRKEAIYQAIRTAKAGEVVVVAGKGHEDYQEIQGVKYPFLDSDVCAMALADRAK